MELEIEQEVKKLMSGAAAAQEVYATTKNVSHFSGIFPTWVDTNRFLELRKLLKFKFVMLKCHQVT